MPAISNWRLDFDPRDKPAVQLTEFGRAIASRLEFTPELEEIISEFLQEKKEEDRKAEEKRIEFSENWFDADLLLLITTALYEQVKKCNFHPTVEAGITKAAKRMLRWNDLSREFTEEEVKKLNSAFSWCLLVGILVGRHQYLESAEFKSQLAKGAAG